MKIPKISITVAKTGPAENAGSPPSFFSITGKLAPKRTEIRTMMANAKLTIKLSQIC